MNLSVRQGDEIVYIERSYSERSGMQVVRTVGGRAPLHLTSVGKLFLAQDDPAACAPTRRAHRAGGTRATASPTRPRWSASWPRSADWGIARATTGTRGRRALHGRRIYDDQNKLVAGLSISPADRLEEAWVDRLKQVAAQISATLGHRG